MFDPVLIRLGVLLFTSSIEWIELTSSRIDSVLFLDGSDFHLLLDENDLLFHFGFVFLQNIDKAYFFFLLIFLDWNDLLICLEDYFFLFVDRIFI
jgi:hypothetical protein